MDVSVDQGTLRACSARQKQRNSKHTSERLHRLERIFSFFFLE